MPLMSDYKLNNLNRNGALMAAIISNEFGQRGSIKNSLCIRQPINQKIPTASFIFDTICNSSSDTPIDANKLIIGS